MYAVIAEPARDFANCGFKADTPFLKASFQLSPSTNLKLNRSCKLGPYSPKYHASAAKERFISLRCRCSRIKASFILGPKRKSLRLSAFKGNGQMDESAGRSSGSKSLKNSVGLSYVPPESEAVSVESLKAQSVPMYSSEAEPPPSSLAMQNLFKSWLMLLRMPLARQAADETLEEPSPTQTTEIENLSLPNGRKSFVTVVWCYLMGLDATVKIPLLIFIPSYLAVNFIYGRQVAKELAPLWIFGPLIVAVYVKLVQSIFALCIFSFKHNVKLLGDVFRSYQVAYGYISHGQLIEDIRGLVKPLVDMKNLNFKEASVRILENWGSSLEERYLDFVESIWPYYCRTIRFLKRAHLI